MAELTVRQGASRNELYSRWGQLKTERASWMAHWQDISRVLLPRAGRFFLQDQNRGQPRHQAIYDNTPTRALRVLGAGLMGGMTSPARPWFRLTTPDPALAKHAPVREWLGDVTRLMLDVFARSNTYRSLHQGYEELGAFGTFACVTTNDFQRVIHHTPLTAGEYCIAKNWQGEIDTIYREFQMPVGTLVKEFGLASCSSTVRNLYRVGSLDQWVPVVHAIEPRADRDPAKRDAQNMAWRSVYFELGSDPDHYLRDGGFNHFPGLTARWATQGGDVYGTSPAMDALGDIKQLQHQQLRKGQVIDYKSNPPLQVPTSMKNREVDTLPGGISYYDAANAQGGIRSAFEVNLDLNHLLEDIQDVRSRVNGAFYSDLFLMLANDQRSGVTATEVAERHEEKMLMLGPVLERLHNELLDPLVESTFTKMVEAGVVPPPPQEMQGMSLDVEFVSMLAQAQRAVATNSIDRYVGNLGAIAQFRPDVLDKFDADRWADEYADMLGVDPRMVVADKKVALIRQQRAQAQAQAQQAALANQAADTAQKLGAAPTRTDNALSDVTQAFSGYT